MTNHLLLAALLITSLASAADETNVPAPYAGSLPGADIQYVRFNRAPGQGMNQAVPETLGRKQFEEVLVPFPSLVETSGQAGSQATP